MFCTIALIMKLSVVLATKLDKTPIFLQKPESLLSLDLYCSVLVEQLINTHMFIFKLFKDGYQPNDVSAKTLNLCP